MTQPKHVLDCLAARETLDLTYPNGALPDGENRSAVESARRHLAICEDCQRVVSRREQLDQRIGAVCRDLDVPAGLKARVLSALAAVETEAADAAVSVSAGGSVKMTGTPSVVSTTSVPLKPSVRRRAMRWSMSAAACLAILMAGIVAWRLSQPRYDFDGLGTALATDGISPDELAEFTTFPGGVFPSLPTTMNTQYLVSAPREFQRAAVYFFSLPMRRGAPLQGRLVVVPTRALLKDSSFATRFLAGTPQYKNGYCLTAWVEDDFSYLCCLTGTENELKRLLPTAAVAI